SSPGPISIAPRMVDKALVPLETPRQWLTPKVFPYSFSKVLTTSPLRRPKICFLTPLLTPLLRFRQKLASLESLLGGPWDHLKEQAFHFVQMILLLKGFQLPIPFLPVKAH